MLRIASTSSYVEEFREDNYTEGGDGILVLGTIRTQRFHIMTSKIDIHRYLVFLVEVAAAHRRVVNKYGNEEIITDMMEDAPTKLSESELCALLGRQSNQVIPPDLCAEDLLPLTHPTVPHSFAFFVDPDMVKNSPLRDGEKIILRTKGNSVFVAKVSRCDMFHFEGMENQNLLAQIAKSTDEYMKGHVDTSSNQQGADDSEWD
ncbi:arpin-like [Schistocerca gregaria]|uniref:arpin-like n=1 Tax=Schistocerca gregaria TaxID=7010 RepID=UPI00211E3590|nr:arpin-like [Schistocerca gregaria]